MTHICVVKLTIIGSDNSLSPERRQAIIWTNAWILLIGPLDTNFKEISIGIQTFSLKKIRLKMSSAKCCSFRLGLNVLTVLTVQAAPSSVHTCILRLLHSPDRFSLKPLHIYWPGLPRVFQCLTSLLCKFGVWIVCSCGCWMGDEDIAQ